MEVIHTIGRRKTAVARIYLKAGNGTITVNKRELNNYFTVLFEQLVHVLEDQAPSPGLIREINFDIVSTSSEVS